MKKPGKFRCGDLSVEYLLDPVSGRVELRIIPYALRSSQVTKRENLHEEFYIKSFPDVFKPCPSDEPDSLFHLHIQGDVYPGGFSGGISMKGSSSIARFRFKNQKVKNDRSGIEILTQFISYENYKIEHHLQWKKGEKGVRVWTVFVNASAQKVVLEMLSSFSLGGITPFDSAEATGALFLHRFRSMWSAEGRHERLSFEELQLERSWSGHSAMSERFGQVGSMPVNRFFPWIGVEDAAKGVMWAAQLVVPGSWQLEVFRKGDSVSISGGIADRELGHWTKSIRGGEKFQTPEVLITAVSGGMEKATHALVEMSRPPQKNLPKSEKELPVIFNEWCTSWGNPNHENLIALADRVKTVPIRYLVIDDGWAKREGRGFQQNGDWILDDEKFPQGLAATCSEIRKRGLIPGIWFEFEVCNPGSNAFEKTDHQLHRDGKPLQVGSRRFWDFRDPWVHRFLEKKVIELIQKNNIGYLKVDYNDTIGIGCDGADSLGEGLREHLEGVSRFFRRLREVLPELVIENCSSGGHRLEPSMMKISSMGSFSDAHELVEIPILAANLHHLIHPTQSQVWAVLRKEDSKKRLYYSLTATFLGRMCLSGDVHQLASEQWLVVREAIHFYQKTTSILKNGETRRYSHRNKSYRKPQGWQAIVRSTSKSALVVIHFFAELDQGPVTIPLPSRMTKVKAVFGEKTDQVTISGKELIIQNSSAWTGIAILLT